MKRTHLVIIAVLVIINLFLFSGCTDKGKKSSGQTPSASSIQQQASSIAQDYVKEASDNIKGDPMEVAKSKTPNYPFEQIPLYKPAAVTIAKQQTAGDDMGVSLAYYTNGTVDETLNYFRQTLKKYDRYSEDTLQASTGKSYDLSFAIKGEHNMDCGVMVMEMPKSTGYTCAVSVQVAIRGIAKKEVKPVEIGSDGVPTNFPKNDVPLFKLSSIFEVDGQSNGGYVQFESSGTANEVVQFYHDKLSGKPSFTQKATDEGGTSLTCNLSEWQIEVKVQDSDGHAYVEINYYALSN